MDSSSGRPKIRSRCRNVVPTPSGPGEVRRISAAPLQGGSFSKSLTKANTCSTGRLITTLCCNPAISIAPCIRSTAGVHRTGRTSRHRYGHRYGDRRTPSLWARHRRPGSHHSNLSAIVRSGFCNCEYAGGGSGGSLAGLASAPRHDWLCNWHPVVGCLQLCAVCRGAGVGLAHLAGLIAACPTMLGCDPSQLCRAVHPPRPTPTTAAPTQGGPPHGHAGRAHRRRPSASTPTTGTLTAAAVTNLGGVLAQTTTGADAAGYQRLLDFAHAHLPGRRCWAARGDGQLGRRPGGVPATARRAGRPGSVDPGGQPAAPAPKATRWTRSGPPARRLAKTTWQPHGVGVSGRGPARAARGPDAAPPGRG